MMRKLSEASSDVKEAHERCCELVTRRSLLNSAMGIGALAALDLLGGRSALAAPSAGTSTGANLGVLRSPLYAASAKRVISIHMWGAVSQVDTFDYKPTLTKLHGQEIPPSVKGAARVSGMSNGQSSFPIFGAIAPFRQYGQSGTWASDLVPHMGAIGDDLTFIHTLHTPHVNHDPATIFLRTGSQLTGRPSQGAWVNYALGSDNANLPSFVVLNTKGSGGNSANPALWGSGFLPSHHQGVQLQPGAEPVLYLSNPAGVTATDRQAELDAIALLDRTQHQRSGDPEILSRLKQYEMVGRMQLAVPEMADISDEPRSVLDLYGPDVHKPGTFARNALLTRRLIERGVKFVEMIHVGWDHHASIRTGHPAECKSVDQASAALVTDLKRRGLLDDTLVIWGSEFGRTSFAQGRVDEPTAGRDHHGGNFTYWLAGGGTKPGVHYGQTDDFSYNIVKDPVAVHDLHATMLHLLGIDHKQLTYHYQGRDFRLTDVEGKIVKGILA